MPNYQIVSVIKQNSSLCMFFIRLGHHDGKISWVQDVALVVQEGHSPFSPRCGISVFPKEIANAQKYESLEQQWKIYRKNVVNQSLIH